MKPVIIIAIAFVLLIPIPVFAEISITSDGGDCSKIGNWDSNSKTCTLNIDTSESIVINTNYVTLDGNNYIITGDGDTSSGKNAKCISMDAKIGITVKNFKLTKCGYGIEFQDVLNSSFIGNEIYNNLVGGISFTFSDDNIIKNNKIYENGQSGISFRGNGNLFEANEISANAEIYSGKMTGWGIHTSTTASENIFVDNVISNQPWGLNFDGVHSKNEIRNNIISDNGVGLRLNTSEKLVIENNIIKSNAVGIASYMYEGKGGKHTIQGNVISENIEGIRLDSGYSVLTENTIISNSEYGLKLLDIEQRRSNHNNEIFNNNFIDNSRQVMYGEKNLFTVNGFGNYWDDFSSNCADKNSDKICDEPYPFSSGTVGIIDTAVWVEKDGWLTSNLNEIIHEPIPEPEQIVCPQGFEPVNGKCPDKPVVESIIEPKLGIASFVDKSKNPQSYIDRYNSEPTYKKWFDDNYSQYDSIEQAVGLTLTEKIPSWVKSIFLFYGQDKISEDELLNAIEYLIDEGILVMSR